MTDNGVAPSKLDQPWISAQENKGVRREVCCRMLGRNDAPVLRIKMATFSCTTPRNDAFKKHQTSEQHDKSVFEELGIRVGPLPLDVFSEVFSKLQSGKGGTG
ncbi:MAG: hypothetical protein ACKPKO_42195, partial [Candidatus Fonsibacter sp.]